MTIDTIDECPSYLNTIGALEAWKFSRGENAAILVLDSCIDEKHQAFESRVIKEDSKCKPYDPKSTSKNYVELFGKYIHGTAVAGTIIAKASEFVLYNTSDHLVKICGIAPKAHVHGFEFDFSIASPDELNSKFDDLLQFKQVSPVTKNNKPLFKKHERLAVIGSLSMGQEVVSRESQDDWNQFMRDACSKDFFLGIIAVGNDGVDLAKHKNKYIPANLEKPTTCQYDPFLRVGSLDSTQILKAEHSNYGQKVDILAPGINIPVPIPFNKSYIVNGTSFSAPIVSGTIALLLKCNPFAKASEIRSAIIDNADKYQSLSHYVQEGRVLNVNKSVTAFCSKKQPTTLRNKAQLQDEL